MCAECAQLLFCCSFDWVSIMENLPRHFLPTASHPGRPLRTLAGHFSRTLSRAVSAESAFSQIRLPPPNKRIFRPSIAQLPSPGYRIHRTSKRECSVLFSPFYFFVNSFPSSARRRLHQNAFWPKMVPRRDFHTHFRPEKKEEFENKASSRTRQKLQIYNRPGQGKWPGR